MSDIKYINLECDVNKILIINALIAAISITVLINSIVLADVELSKKDVRALGVMEGRLFQHKSVDETNEYRLSRLENELLYQTHENEDAKKRIERLKIASQKKELTGMAIPLGMSPKFSPNRLNNDSVPDYESVGIIDGLIKVYFPDAYEKIRYRENLWQKFNSPLGP